MGGGILTKVNGFFVCSNPLDSRELRPLLGAARSKKAEPLQQPSFDEQNPRFSVGSRFPTGRYGF